MARISGGDAETPTRRFGTYYRTTCVANWRWRDGRLARPAELRQEEQRTSVLSFGVVLRGEDARLSIAAKMRADQFLSSGNCIRKRLLENVPPAIATSNISGSFDFARLSPRFAQDDSFGGVTLIVKVDYDGLRG